MYGYIRQGRRTALTREVMGGVAFQVLTVGPGLLRRLRVRRLLRRMARHGVGTAVFEDGAWRETAARYGIRPVAVGPLRLAKLGELLDRDVPVILSIGRNFPRVWRNVETAFYTPGRESGPPACSTNAHFVTVTAMDEDYLTVSSWGHPYRLSREEFDAYRREASASLLCTILDVRKK
mgnify:CR=1 FL=1